MFGDSSAYDGVYFLIDADGNPATGYQFGGIGAEGVVEIFGANNTVAGARLYGFPTNAEVNWSQRQPLGSPSAAASVQGVEAQVSTYDLTGFDRARFRIAVFADDFAGVSSRSLAPLTPNGSVLVELLPLTSVVSGTTTSWFTIRVHALGLPAGASWGVSSFVYIATPGLTVFLSTGSVTLTQAQPEATITASVFASGISPGNVVQINVTNATAPVPIVIRDGSVRAYVVGPPSTVQVDGLFADWVGRDQTDSDPVPVKNPDVDIVRYGAATSNLTAFFHVRVAGTLLDGRVPQRNWPLPPASGNGSSGGGSSVLPRRTGEDVLLVYLDANSSDTRGLPIGGIFADTLIDIRGEGGRINSKTVFTWSNGWIRAPGVQVAAEKNETDIEASLPLPGLNGTRVVIQSTDWSSTGDLTAAFGAPAFVSPVPRGMSTLGLEAPQANGFAGLTFYLRDALPGIAPPDCAPNWKSLNTSPGSSSKTLTLSTLIPRACFFTDPESSSETIPAGAWSVSLDLTTSSTSVKIEFFHTVQDGTAPVSICPITTTVVSGDNQLLSCDAPAISLNQNDRIRLVVDWVSGSDLTINYDGGPPSTDSSLTVPIPEFSDLGGPALVGGVLVIMISARRRRPRRGVLP